MKFWVEGLVARCYEITWVGGYLIEWIWLWRVLKCMGILIVKLKAIKYKKDSFCYLSSYSLDLGLLAVCLLTLSFRPYAFKTFVSSAEHICSPKPSRILDPFYNLNLICWVFCWPPKGQLLLQQLGWPNTKEPYLLYPMNRIFFYPHDGSKGLGFCVD